MNIIKVNLEMKRAKSTLDNLTEEIKQTRDSMRMVREMSSGRMGETDDLRVFDQKLVEGINSVTSLEICIDEYAKLLESFRLDYETAQEEAILRAIKIRKP